MKDEVILLNSSRGTLINEDILLKNLASGKTRGAWFDTFWEEPYSGEVQKFNNVLLTPHISTYTRKCRLEMEMAATENLLNDLGII